MALKIIYFYFILTIIYIQFYVTSTNKTTVNTSDVLFTLFSHGLYFKFKEYNNEICTGNNTLSIKKIKSCVGKINKKYINLPHNNSTSAKLLYRNPFFRYKLHRVKRSETWPVDINTTRDLQIHEQQLNVLVNQENLYETGNITSEKNNDTFESYFNGKQKTNEINSSNAVVVIRKNIVSVVETGAHGQMTGLSENDTISPLRTSGDLKFLDAPPGGKMRVPDLELGEGYLIFSFLSPLVAFLQTAEFPINLIRDWSRNQLSTLQLIIQSVRVEVGFICCLVILMFAALALSAVLLAQLCRVSPRDCEARERYAPLSDTQLRCRKLILLILLELILILLPLGMVGIFLSNEYISRSVYASPEVTEVVFSDLDTFVRNTYLQIRFVTTTSADQAIDATIEDLEDIEDLLGKPIQRELAAETGIDVALDALSDICSASADIATEVLTLRAEGQAAREAAHLSQDRLKELRKQVETTKKQCIQKDQPLCDTIDTTGLEITFKVDKLLAERKLSRLRHLGDNNLTLAVDEARLEFHGIPQRVVRETLHTKTEIKSILREQRDLVHDSIVSLEDVTRDFTTSISVANGRISRVVRAIVDVEQWRWLSGFSASLAVFVIWFLLSSGALCAHCGCTARLALYLLAAIAAICCTSVLLWLPAALALIIGGHGELFICRPLYDTPNYTTLAHLLDNPSILYQQGGMFSNILRGNNSMDVPIKNVLRECRMNQPAFPTFNLNQIFNIDSVTNHLTWPKFHGHLSNLTVSINDVTILKPNLQKYLQDLSQASRVNLTLYRTQMSSPVMATDINAFADLLERIANQMTDLTTSARMETLASRSRKLFSNYLQRLEKHKDQLLYKVTALEVHLLPFQKQANQSLSHLKTIQYYLANQGSIISQRMTKDYVSKLIRYLERFREHVLNQLTYEVAPCKPVWDIFHRTRLQLCKNIVEPMNGFFISTAWCLILFIIVTPITFALVDFYKYLLASAELRRDLGELLLGEQVPWTTSTPRSSPESLPSPEQSSWVTPRRPSEQLLIPPPRQSPAQLISPRSPTTTRTSPRPRFHESLRMIEPLVWRSPRITSPRGWL